MEPALTITGQLSSTDPSTTFSVRIERPRRDSPTDDYVCRVSSSAVIGINCDVKGILAQYAMASAIDIVAAMVARKFDMQLTDESQ